MIVLYFNEYDIIYLLPRYYICLQVLKRLHFDFLACSEVVTWIVATKQPTVPSAVMKSLRKMTTDDGEPLVNNFRPVQQLNGRQVLLVEQVEP